MTVLQGGGDLGLFRLEGQLRGFLRRECTQVGDIATEGMGQLSAVVGEDLCVVGSARDGYVGHAVVEQIFGTEFGVHMDEDEDEDEDAVGGLALAGVAGHGVAVVEVRMPRQVDLDRAASVNWR
jgi:hypothetical protein